MSVVSWTLQSGAKSLFLNISRDKLKNMYMAPLREVHWGFLPLTCNHILSSFLGQTLLVKQVANLFSGLIAPLSYKAAVLHWNASWLQKVIPLKSDEIVVGAGFLWS